MSADNNLKSMEFPQEKCYNKNGVVQKTPARCVEEAKRRIHAGMFLRRSAAADGERLQQLRDRKEIFRMALACPENMGTDMKKKRVKLKGRLRIYMQTSLYLGLLLVLIHLSHVDSFQENCVLMGERSFYLGRKDRKEFFHALSTYLSEGRG